MANDLIAGTGALGKNKTIVVSLSGFTGIAGQTSNFGLGTEVNCTDVEYLSVTKPEKSENESMEIQTNQRSIKDDSANEWWDDYSGLEVVNDKGNVNWKAFVAAQETDATGTLTFAIKASGVGTDTTNTAFAKYKVKIAKSGGGGGDASGFDTSFTPTFRILESLALS